MIEVSELLASPFKPQPDEVNTVLDEMADALLESPKQIRDEFLKELVPLRERMRALEKKNS